MKLHIGCGFRNLPGYKHFDIRKLDGHIDYVGSADDLSQFPDGSVEEIYACHLLEHFGRDKVNDVLKEWYRVLCPRGGADPYCSAGFWGSCRSLPRRA